MFSTGIPLPAPNAPGQVGTLYNALSKEALANQAAAIQNQYMPQKLAQANLLAQQQNQFYAPNIQSEIGLRGAQAGEATAHGGYLNSEAAVKNYLLREAMRDQARSSNNAVASLPYGNGPSVNQMSSPNQGQNGEDLNANGGAGGGGNAPPQQSVQQQSQRPTKYGIPYPDVSSSVTNPAAGMLIHASPDDISKMENYNKLVQHNSDEYQHEVVETNKGAQAATLNNQLLSAFGDALKGSTFKGPATGWVPSENSKITTALSALHDFTPEQRVDRLEKQILPSAIGTLRDAMGKGNFSIPDLNAASALKVNRNMSDDNFDFMKKYFNAVNERLKEKARFYTTNSNVNSDLQKKDSDAMWSAYQNQNPIINKDGTGINKYPADQWRSYLTPEGKQSIKTTGDYTPSLAPTTAKQAVKQMGEDYKNQTIEMISPDGKIYHVPQGKAQRFITEGKFRRK